jgi:hypothetical protein
MLLGAEVAKVYADETDGWDEERWAKCMRENHILVGTAEIFRKNFLDRG